MALMFPYILLAFISVVAVLNPCFKDNLIQRIGLAGICIGSCLKVFTFIVHQSAGDSCAVMAYGMAFYAIGTVLKFHKFNQGTQ